MARYGSSKRNSLLMNQGIVRTRGLKVTAFMRTRERRTQAMANHRADSRLQSVAIYRGGCGRRGGGGGGGGGGRGRLRLEWSDHAHRPPHPANRMSKDLKQRGLSLRRFDQSVMPSAGGAGYRGRNINVVCWYRVTGARAMTREPYELSIAVPKPGLDALWGEVCAGGV